MKKKQQPTWHMKMLGCLVHAGSGVELTVTGRTPATISACSQPKTNQKAEHECSLDTPISHEPKHKPESTLTNDGYESTELKSVLFLNAVVIQAVFYDYYRLLTLDKISIISRINSVTDCVVKREMKII